MNVSVIVFLAGMDTDFLGTEFADLNHKKMGQISNPKCEFEQDDLSTFSAIPLIKKFHVILALVISSAGSRISQMGAPPPLPQGGGASLLFG